jgi:hypothetical protein
MFYSATFRREACLNQNMEGVLKPRCHKPHTFHSIGASGVFEISESIMTNLNEELRENVPENEREIVKSIRVTWRSLSVQMKHIEGKR